MFCFSLSRSMSFVFQQQESLLRHYSVLQPSDGTFVSTVAIHDPLTVVARRTTGLVINFITALLLLFPSFAKAKKQRFTGFLLAGRKGGRKKGRLLNRANEAFHYGRIMYYYYPGRLAGRAGHAKTSQHLSLPSCKRQESCKVEREREMKYGLARLLNLNKRMISSGVEAKT